MSKLINIILKFTNYVHKPARNGEAYAAPTADKAGVDDEIYRGRESEKYVTRN